MRVLERILKHPVLLALALALFEAIAADLRRRSRKS